MTHPNPEHLHLGIALDGAGWHPAAWREADAQPDQLFDADYWIDLVQQAETGLLDFVSIEDGLAVQSDSLFVPDERTDRVRGRLDATLIAARVAPYTHRIGFLPTAVVTHTEPFHLSKFIATLDWISKGRAGIRVQVGSRPSEAAHFGRRALPPLTLEDFQRDTPELVERLRETFDEAADYVEVLRRLWDSWEDDAEIRDVATGRFIDRDKVHHIDFEGRFFSVKGPSITQRPPQGQPVVAALAHRDIPFELVGRSADLGFITPTGADDAAEKIGLIRRAQEKAGRGSETVHVFGDLVVFLDPARERAEERKRRLDEIAGTEYASDAHVFVGTPAELADLLLDWSEGGLTGYRLRPGVLAHDLEQVVSGLVPELQRRGAFRTSYEANTFRGLLGLDRPLNRYATTKDAVA